MQFDSWNASFQFSSKHTVILILAHTFKNTHWNHIRKKNCKTKNQIKKHVSTPFISIVHAIKKKPNVRKSMGKRIYIYVLISNALIVIWVWLIVLTNVLTAWIRLWYSICVNSSFSTSWLTVWSLSGHVECWHRWWWQRWYGTVHWLTGSCLIWL